MESVEQLLPSLKEFISHIPEEFQSWESFSDVESLISKLDKLIADEHKDDSKSVEQLIPSLTSFLSRLPNEYQECELYSDIESLVSILNKLINDSHVDDSKSIIPDPDYELERLKKEIESLKNKVNSTNTQYFEVFDEFINNREVVNPHKIWVHALKRNNFELMKHYFKRAVTRDYEITEVMEYSTSPEIIEYTLDVASQRQCEYLFAEAISSNKAELLPRILERTGMSIINEERCGYPLIWTVRFKYDECFDYLMSVPELDINVRSEGHHPLYFAIEKENYKAFNDIINSGKVHCSYDDVDCEKMTSTFMKQLIQCEGIALTATALHRAVENGWDDIVKELIRRKCQSTTTILYQAINSDCPFAIQLIPLTPNIDDKEKTSPLYAAISKRNIPVFHALLNHGAYLGYYELRAVIERNYEPEMLDICLEHGGKFESGHLFKAVVCGNEPAIRWLKEHNVPVNEQTKEYVEKNHVYEWLIDN